MNKILNFPSISLPNDIWTMQALFYWDEIATIVPIEFTKNPEKFTPFTRELIQKELIKQIIPEEYTHTYHKDLNKFLNFIDESSEVRNILDTHNQVFRNEKMDGYNIHMGKLSFLGDAFVERGLAIRNHHWYSVEPQIAKAYMTFLAVLIGQETEYVPMANSYDGFSSVYNIQNQPFSDPINQSRATLRNSILHEILPVPSHVPDVYDILRFKEHHMHELHRFRDRVESFLLDLETYPVNQQNERRDIFVEDAKDEINEISDKMAVWGGRITLGTICSLSAAALALAADPSNLISLAAGTTGLAGLLYESFVAGKEKQRKKPLAYGAILSNKF